MKLNSKILQMQLYYETGAEDSLLASIESFRHFLVNDKLIHPQRKLLYSGFHKYLNKLVLAKNKKDKNEIGMLHKNISKDNNVMAKHWLAEKAFLIKS